MRPDRHRAIAGFTHENAAQSREGACSSLGYAVCFVNQGARVRIEVSSAGALDRVRQLLPVGSTIEASDPLDAVFSLSIATAPHRLARDGVLLQASPDCEVLLRRLESELHFAVASNARTALFVHAGVVRWQDHAILLPGASMSGKSSLVAALLRAGADYYSDEYAVIDASGRVHPYAKPLLLRQPDAGRNRAGRPAPLSPARTPPLPASLIVSTHYQARAHFEPGLRGRSHGLMILVANTLLIRERPRFALDHLMPIADTATTLEGARGDADEAAEWLLRYQRADK